MEEGTDYGYFPPGFSWGVTSSAFQTEGSLHEDGSGLCIWDRQAHVQNGSLREEGDDVIERDAACRSYERFFKEDIRLLKDLHVNFYRFSLSWSRLFPDGVVDETRVNPQGLLYYNRLINCLHNSGITPVATLLHHDLPAAMAEGGGWHSGHTVKQLVKYARFCFKNFGDRVKTWLTINDPYTEAIMCCGLVRSYEKSREKRIFLSIHNMLKAHAQIYKVYDQEFRPSQQGRISLPLSVEWENIQEARDREHDVSGSTRLLEFRLGLFTEPVYVSGDYSATLRAQVGRNLPPFTKEESSLIKGSMDFFALNHYPCQPSPHATNLVVRLATYWRQPGDKLMSWQNDDVTSEYGLRQTLKWIKQQCNNPPIYIMENGVFDSDGHLEDFHRIKYMRSCIQDMFKAIYDDGCDVKGYSAFTLMDSFHWTRAYHAKYGMFHVDHTDYRRMRKKKLSAKFYSALVIENGFRPSEIK